MKELIRKLYPVVLPPLCLLAGVLAIVFFAVGPAGKGSYDILAIGVVLIFLSIIQIIGILISIHKERKEKK